MTMIDLLILGIGIYTIYTAIMMKKSQDLKKGWLIGNDVNMRKVRDAKGYIEYIFGKTVFVGGMTVLYGLVGIVTSYVTLSLPIDPEIVMTAVYFVVLVWFVWISVRARDTYLDGTPKKKAKEK